MSAPALVLRCPSVSRAEQYGSADSDGIGSDDGFVVTEQDAEAWRNPAFLRSVLRLQTAFRASSSRRRFGRVKTEASSQDAAITVAIRMRPLVPHERNQKAVFGLSNNTVATLRDAGLEEDQTKEGPWKFDVAMDSSQPLGPAFVDNASCYEQMGKRMIGHILSGYNTGLFCYGQTGTGKTTTIMGDANHGPGLLRRLLDDIFVEKEKLLQTGAEVSVEVVMLEVYNEELRDLLLRPADRKEKVQARILAGKVVIQGASVKSVDSADECHKLIDFGNENKVVAPTAMNPQSSRGHTVFRLTFKKKGGPDASLFTSEVYFADLAGHENIRTTAVTGDRLKELAFINGSLMWLQNALHTMAQDSSKKGSKKEKDASGGLAKFRNSKLTLAMANTLVGNSKAAVIITISPAIAHFDTSLSSIKFGCEVKGVKMKAIANTIVDPQSIIKKLEKEIDDLKAQLAKALGAGSRRGSAASACGTPRLAVPDEMRRIKTDITGGRRLSSGSATGVSLRSPTPDLTTAAAAVVSEELQAKLADLSETVETKEKQAADLQVQLAESTRLQASQSSKLQKLQDELTEERARREQLEQQLAAAEASAAAAAAAAAAASTTARQHSKPAVNGSALRPLDLNEFGGLLERLSKAVAVSRTNAAGVQELLRQPQS
eukprot:TRINITY_DN21040_c1_g1_i1.p1 TRINITY_DN21040_c1_g1~~TRINITY_DN21040_c1_g1_i1.p1  ORF type:complete len:673 (-),score=221.68 TRINITY_DN21040_c1_g1_i1:152-2131(-)